MNKKTTLLLCLIGTSFLSGCSGVNVFEGRSFWGDEAKELATVQDSPSTEAPSQESPSSNESKERYSLSEDEIDSFPSWFDLDSLGSRKWVKVVLNPNISLSKNLHDSGIDTGWMRDLRTADYIDLSTISDQQVVWVELSEGGMFKSLYTPVTSQSAYYVDQTDLGPVMSRGGVSPIVQGSFELGPDTDVNSLSAIQKLAVKDFLSKVLPIIDHDAEVLLSKGKTDVFFDYTYIKRKRTGMVRVRMVKSQYKDLLMTYRPE